MSIRIATKHLPGYGCNRKAIGMLARVRRVVATSLLLLGLAALTPPAAAQLVNPFGRDAISMSQEDLALMHEAIDTALNAQKAGAAASWKNEKTGRAGRVVVQRTFTRSDMPCAEVLHRFTSGGGQSYLLPFCRTADGSWKLAF
jgi:surface antigen